MTFNGHFALNSVFGALKPGHRSLATLIVNVVREL